MVDDSKLFDIDYLRNNNTRLYYFGLGFIQLVFNKSQRIHFYNSKMEQTNDEIHNHRYNFKSKILKGHFLQTKYKLVEGDSHILKNESCGSNAIVLPCEIPVGVEKIIKEGFCENEEYFITYNEFHNVSFINNTITLLTRSEIITDYAQVIYEKDKEPICPFSTKIEDRILWDIIEDTIKYE
jgi:hypothetical protein